MGNTMTDERKLEIAAAARRSATWCRESPATEQIVGQLAAGRFPETPGLYACDPTSPHAVMWCAFGRFKLEAQADELRPELLDIGIEPHRVWGHWDAEDREGAARELEHIALLLQMQVDEQRTPESLHPVTRLENFVSTFFWGPKGAPPEAEPEADTELAEPAAVEKPRVWFSKSQTSPFAKLMPVIVMPDWPEVSWLDEEVTALEPERELALA